jgi:hypothetical protein
VDSVLAGCWYGSSYLLTTCAVSLTFGKLYTFYSIKWIYLIALFIFEEVGVTAQTSEPTSKIKSAIRYIHLIE